MKDKSDGEVDFRINILDPTPNCPAHRYANRHIVADFKDEDAIKQLATISDVISYEIELGNADALTKLNAEGARMFPSPQTLRTIQDKYTQKEFLRSRGVPVADFVEIGSLEELRKFAKDYGYPSMLKARRDGYDGRGNFLVRGEDQVEEAYRKFEGRELMLERFIPFGKEVSVIAARGVSGEIAAFSVGENIHEDSILKMTIMPARTSGDISDGAQRLAARVMAAFGDCGVFGIEMFVCDDGRILVNEVAPRVHNSGHGTLEKSAFDTSQFEQHLRSISGMPLGCTRIRRPVVMQNILGEKGGFSGPYKVVGDDEARMMVPGAHVHLYGKGEVRPLRKMGHVSVVGGVDVFGLYSDAKLIIDDNPEDPMDERSVSTLIRRAELARQLVRVVPA
jgi:5-(carboxyamino)imidazole ribonucleotide synthase